MPRTDEDLYTGMTSASAAKVKAQRTRIADKKKEDRAVLQKDDHLILNTLQVEIDSIPRQIFDLVTIDDNESDVRAKLIALKLYEEKLIVLKQAFENTLRVKKARGSDDD